MFYHVPIYFSLNLKLTLQPYILTSDLIDQRTTIEAHCGAYPSFKDYFNARNRYLGESCTVLLLIPHFSAVFCG